jgi:hypothetical protein
MSHTRVPEYIAVIKGLQKPNVDVVLHRLDLRTGERHCEEALRSMASFHRWLVHRSHTEHVVIEHGVKLNTLNCHLEDRMSGDSNV